MSLPLEKAIPFGTYQVGGKNKKEINHVLRENGINFYNYRVKKIINTLDPELFKTSENLNLVKIRVGDLGFINNPNTEELCETAKNFNFLTLRPDIIASPNLYENFSENEGAFIVGRHENIFNISRFDNAFWLIGYRVAPDCRWSIKCNVLFNHRNPQATATLRKK